ncbi:unnamed protein product [Adineta steineri]|uniref:G-protein coupled receptors family 1 profile domain-containing protein n=1 Tax=Adineta steineri TaxID=433720 RepID=A0A815ZE98_9BILA|nr:unnamed protein product [Adineta steineri]CAF1317860.1 unnamed protein product [Adineta steineri]CAF1526920.1 unnamed protein product [Adineta steineri]CAF1583425.1 unnamed protein product [Adineta steineri]
MPISNISSSNIIKFVYDDGIAIPYIVRFWIFLISNILSLICCLFVLYQFLFDSNLRRGLHNHVIIVVLFMCLIMELTTIPWKMYLYLYGVAWIQTPTFCMIWKFLDSTLYTTTAKLVGWASVERHILIFHDQWVSTKKKQFFIHYLPLIFIVLYGIVVYGTITPMNGCNRSFYYFITFWGYSSWVYNSLAFGLYEFMTGAILCSILIGFGSIFLVLRVILRKRHLQQQIQWRKHRKMILQLLSVSSLFFVLYLPPVMLAVAHKVGVPSYVGAQYNTYASLFSYYIAFLFPFTCLSTIPELGTRIKNIFRCRWRQQMRSVAPQK